MSKIFELKEQQQQLLDSLTFIDEESEQDEFNLIKRALDEITGDVESKLVWLSGILAEARAQEAQADNARKMASERLTKQLNRAQKNTERLTDFILDTMTTFDIKTVKGDIINMTRSMSAGSVVYDSDFKVEYLPFHCVKVIPEQVEPVKSEIAKHLKAGEEIPGCYLVKKASLRVS